MFCSRGTGKPANSIAGIDPVQGIICSSIDLCSIYVAVHMPYTPGPAAMPKTALVPDYVALVSNCVTKYTARPDKLLPSVFI